LVPEYLGIGIEVDNWEDAIRLAPAVLLVIGVYFGVAVSISQEESRRVALIFAAFIPTVIVEIIVWIQRGLQEIGAAQTIVLSQPIGYQFSHFGAKAANEFHLALVVDC
jgi:hypothetical protein